MHAIALKVEAIYKETDPMPSISNDFNSEDKKQKYDPDPEFISLFFFNLRNVTVPPVIKQNYKMWQLAKKQLNIIVEKEEISNDKKRLRIAMLEERFETHHSSLFKNNIKALKRAIAKCSMDFYADKKY